MLGNIEALKFLISSGASVDIPDMNGWSPIATATWKGNCDTIRVLADAGSNIDCRTNTGLTLPLVAIQGKQIQSLEVLIEIGVDMNSSDVNGTTPMIQAAQMDDVKSLLLLLSANIETSTSDINGVSPLHAAALSGKINALKVLLRNDKSQLENCDLLGSTPLHSAVLNCKFEAAKVLLEHGAQIHALDGLHRSPIYIAACVLKQIPKNNLKTTNASVGKKTIRKNIFNSNIEDNVDAFYDPYHDTCKGITKFENLQKIVEILLDAKIDVNLSDLHGRTPLLLAAGAKHSNAVCKFMSDVIAHGALIDFTDNRGRTPLLESARSGNVKGMSLLLSNGANLYTTDFCGQGIIELAADRGHSQVIQYLLEIPKHNLMINLYTAVSLGNVHLVRILIHLGVVHQEFNDTKPLAKEALKNIAREKGYKEILLILESASILWPRQKKLALLFIGKKTGRDYNDSQLPMFLWASIFQSFLPIYGDWLHLKELEMIYI